MNQQWEKERQEGCHEDVRELFVGEMEPDGKATLRIYHGGE